MYLVTISALSSSAMRAFAMSCSNFAISACGATHTTLPLRRLSSDLACRTMSSAWSHGTLIRRSVTLPVTLSLATMFRSDSSAMSCSTVRTGTSWKLNVTGRPR